jgi:hypothetical protein
MTDPLFQVTKRTLMVVDDGPDIITLLRDRLEQEVDNELPKMQIK